MGSEINPERVNLDIFLDLLVKAELTSQTGWSWLILALMIYEGTYLYAKKIYDRRN